MDPSGFEPEASPMPWARATVAPRARIIFSVMDAPGIEPGASPVLEHNMPCEGCVLPMNYAPEYNMRIYRLARFKKLLIRATDYSRLSRM